MIYRSHPFLCVNTLFDLHWGKEGICRPSKHFSWVAFWHGAATSICLLKWWLYGIQTQVNITWIWFVLVVLCYIYAAMLLGQLGKSRVLLSLSRRWQQYWRSTLVTINGPVSLFETILDHLRFLPTGQKWSQILPDEGAAILCRRWPWSGALVSRCSEYTSSK